MNFRFYLGITIAVVIGILGGYAVLEGFSYAKNVTVYYKNTGQLTFKPTYIERGAEGPKIEYEFDQKHGQYRKMDENLIFPKITAQAYLVGDIDTGEIIESKNLEKIYPIASLTKLLTALISIETIDQYSQINITRKAVDTYGKQGNLRTGEILSANELLYPLLLESSNDAAEALAIFAGRDDFINNMNKKAESLGMSDSSFDDASGLSYKNTSTALDLFRLIRYIDQNYGEIFSITDKKSVRIKKHNWFNNSKFINDDYYIGGKNGYTDEAKHTLITMFELPLSDFENRRIAVILLHANRTTERDTRDILFYLLRNVIYEAK